MRGTSGGPEEGKACLCTHTCTHASNKSGPGPSGPLPWPTAAGHGDGLVLEHPWLWLGSPLRLRAKAADKRAWNMSFSNTERRNIHTQKPALS